MNGTTVLQIPMDKALRRKATTAAAEMGFSSLQESVRVFLKQMAKKVMRVTFEPKTIQLSPKAIKRYNKIIDEIDSGKAKLKNFDSDEEMFSYLNRL